MRSPTGISERWAWWESFMRGENPPVYEGEPQCGFFKVRRFSWGQWASKENPWDPASIWMAPQEIDDAGDLMDDEKLFCEINGKRDDPWKKWTYLCKHPVSESEHQWLTAMAPLRPQRIPKRA